MSRFQPGAWLRVTGEDAATFLQGQFTQETRPERSSAATYGLLLTQKGKVVADAWVLRLGRGEYRLWSPWVEAATIRERLEAYIVADDVTIEDEGGAVEGWVLAGEAGREALVAAGITPPSAGAVSVWDQGWVFRGRRGVAEAWEWLRLAGWADGPEENLRAEAWEQARIAAGVPRVPVDVGPEDLPAEGGLDAVAIAYDKGCYLGQEVMARLKSMGRVRRRLLRVHGTGPVPTVAAAQIVDEAGQVLGEVRSAVAVGEGWWGLAMVKLNAVESHPPDRWRLARAAAAEVALAEPAGAVRES
jgi:folate-binding protein YgfZ